MFLSREKWSDIVEKGRSPNKTVDAGEAVADRHGWLLLVVMPGSSTSQSGSVACRKAGW